MDNIRRISLQLLCIVLAFSAVRGQMDEDPGKMIDEAMRQMSRKEQIQVRSFFGTPRVFDSFKEVARCIAKELNPKKLNLCNFDFSIDPFYYINKCANNTPFGKFILALVSAVPSLQPNFGIPPEVDPNRCFLWKPASIFGNFIQTPASSFLKFG